MKDTVLVTGATGFLGQHCVVALLEAGYRVRGTARSIERAARAKAQLAPALSAAARERLADFEIVPAELTHDAGWREAISGCRYVLHVASPLPSARPRDENELIVPARDGALRVLRTAADLGVERVVLTSSVAAILGGAPRDRVYTEDDWSNLNSPTIGAYEKSKTIAEQAAFRFVASLSGTRALQLSVINPGLILGPIFGATVGTSGLVIKKLLNREIPACPDLHFAVVDVRDVAAAHVAAMSAPAVAGERIICAAGDVSLRHMAKLLDVHFRARGFRVPTRPLPDWLFRALALFDPPSRLVLNFLGQPESVDNSKIKRLLGWSPRPVDETVIAMAESMVDQGAVRAR